MEKSARFLDSDAPKFVLCVASLMGTLLVYGVLQERVMKSPYGEEKEFFRYSLFIVFINRLLTCLFAVMVILFQRKALAPVAPLYKYAGVSLSNVVSTTCQYEALKFVSFPVQTLAKCAKMIPVMMWSTFIMQKVYTARDYLIALAVTVGCASFFLTANDAKSSTDERQSSTWGILLMAGYLGFDGFTSTFQDKLFKGYDMEIFNQILYVALCSSALSMIGLVSQGNLFLAVNFVLRHPQCLFDIMIISLSAASSQFFISYTIRNFGALVFATIMTTRQLVSIVLSCIWFQHPLTIGQWTGAGLVFSSLYYKSYVSGSKARETSGALKDIISMKEVNGGSSSGLGVVPKVAPKVEVL